MHIHLLDAGHKACLKLICLSISVPALWSELGSIDSVTFCGTLLIINLAKYFQSIHLYAVDD